MRRLLVLEAVGAAFVEGLQRAWDAGDAVLPVDPLLPAPVRARLLAAARADDPVESGDALVVATSGTSGEPKLAVLTHEAVAASAGATSARLAVDSQRDRWLACLPLSHVGGLSVVTRAVLSGTPLMVHDSFDADTAMTAAADGCTLTSLVPTALARIDPSAFRTILVGGQAPSADRPANVVVTYGMTETGSGVVYDGVPLDGVDVRIATDGEIELRGPMLLRAYRDDSDPKTAESWLPTGDIGELLDGVLSVHGRRDDLVISGGHNVWPAEVERVLRSHPAVADVAVVGRPDAEWGERVTAVIVPADAAAPPSLAELREHVREQLHPRSAPTALELRNSLPRTASGKLRRDAL